MLASIFALAARRDPGFVQYDPAITASGSADIYLVDADSPEALNKFKTLSKRSNLPAVMVGAGDSGGFPLLPRPLQWARLLQALEETVATTVGASQRDDDEGTLPLGTKSLSATAAGRSHPGSGSPPPLDDAAAKKRALGDTCWWWTTTPGVHEGQVASTDGLRRIAGKPWPDRLARHLRVPDVVLPGIDGYQVYKMIRATNRP